MKSLLWELCTVTMAQLTWLSYRLSLMTPSQGAFMALHQAVELPRSRVRAQTKQKKVGKSHLPVVVQALHLTPPDSHPPCLLSQLDHPLPSVLTAPGFWIRDPLRSGLKLGDKLKVSVCRIT